MLLQLILKLRVASTTRQCIQFNLLLKPKPLRNLEWFCHIKLSTYVARMSFWSFCFWRSRCELVVIICRDRLDPQALFVFGWRPTLFRPQLQVEVLPQPCRR